VDTIFDIIDILNNISDGRFKINIKQYPGKKAILTETITKIEYLLIGISTEIKTVAESAAGGNLSQRADIARYSGDWAEILNGINGLVESVNAPIQEAASILRQIAAGNLNMRITNDYKGDFALIKDSVNVMSETVSSYIQEINEVLTMVSNDDLDQEITREYVGQFAVIKTSINMIIDKINSVISDMNSASQQVAAGAFQISSSSMTLAEGASIQTSSVTGLEESLEDIDHKSAENAAHAAQAKELSDKSKNDAIAVNDEMRKMLSAIESIKQSSQDISKIIKTIDDIAFQTNLLALNAAVEAARAGVHGKGFTIVAEEVRNLAAKSQLAAKDTTALIENSINKVAEGDRIAGLTAQFINGIVGNVSEVSGLIENIAVESKKQSGAIKSISDGLHEISQVVQDNSSTAEENAAAAEELSSQSEILKSMVAVFNLKSKARDVRTA
jgi:methyl-accepting chemotaxis protein